MKKAYDFLHKLILVGPSCGKSNILSRFVENQFTDVYISTIGVDFGIKTITVQNKKCKLQIWDTAGPERFRTITLPYYRGSKGFILCFDLTDIQTFNKMNGVLEDVKTQSGDFNSVRIILIGCKCDLKNEIVVSNNQINEFISNAMLKYGKIIEYFETSAKCDINVTKVFELMSNFIMDENYPLMKKLSKVNLEFLLSYWVRNNKINKMYKWFNGINGIIKDYLSKGY